MDRVLESMQSIEPSYQVILIVIYQCQKPVDLKDICLYKFSVFSSCNINLTGFWFQWMSECHFSSSLCGRGWCLLSHKCC